MAGEFVYMADAASLTDCLTGERYPVSMEKDYIFMERAYLAGKPEPGDGVYMTFEGALTDIPAMEGGGTVKGIVVERFIRAWPDEDCERAGADATLENTYWRIVLLGGEEIGTVSGHREPHLVLKTDGEARAYSATVGCNTLSGAYSLEGGKIFFGPGLSTMMACPAPLDERERILANVLMEIRIPRIRGNTMELYDESGTPVALLQAVYFLTD
jgi:heat shock protein HslJ